MERFQAYSGSEPYAFVSYAHADGDRVYPIITKLYDDGYRIWYDEGIEITEIYQAEINRRIERCQIFVFFVSHKSIQSSDVAFEVAYAKARRKPIVIVHIDEVDIDKARAEIRGEITLNQGILWYKYSISECEQKIKHALLTCFSQMNNQKEQELYESKQNNLSVKTYKNFEYLIDNGNATITKYVGTDKDVYVPSVINGVKVSAIGRGAFSNDRSVSESCFSPFVPKDSTEDYIDYYEYEYNVLSFSLKDIAMDEEAEDFLSGPETITIPDGVLYIDEFAFSKCYSLVNIRIPDSIVKIGRYAFLGCFNLEYARIPRSVVSIGYGVFAQCERLKNIYIDQANEMYCTVDGVLFNKDKSVLVCVPSGREGAFSVPNSVLRIEKCAFQGCRNLANIEMTKSVISIASGAFCYSINNKMNISLPDSISAVEKYTFACCDNFSIIIPKSVKSIGESAFFTDKEFWYGLSIDEYAIKVIAPHNPEFYDYQPPKYIFWDKKRKFIG